MYYDNLYEKILSLTMHDFVGDALGFGGRDNSGGRASEQEVLAQQQAIAELRRQFDITQGNIQPFIDSGTGAISQVQEGTTTGGLNDRLNRIFQGGAFQSLVDERGRAVQGQLAASGNSRSGTGLLEAARVPTELGFGIEQLLTGRATNQVASGQNAALGLGSLGAQNSGSIANLLQAQGVSRGAGILTDAQAAASQGQAQLNTLGAGASGLGSILGAAGVAGAGAGGTAGLLGAIGGFFSDPALKENVEIIGEVKDLNLCQWDWIEQANGTMIEHCPNMGFMADEVKAKYPQHVMDYCGFMVIDYEKLLEKLLEELEAA